MDNPKVTFIIPAYNVAPYLQEAVESIQLQTYQDWELIIVDDCSKDKTLAIARELEKHDSRIRVLRTETQSGGAYIPRKLAISNARGSIIAPLDADDKIGPEYLQNLLSMMESRKDVDICYPVMYRWDGTHLGSAYNHDKTLVGKYVKGKDAVKYTLDGWRIHCNGGIIRKEVYLKAFESIKENDIEVRSYIDEYLSRHLLFNARNVAICDEKYYYLQNPSSITHSADIRAFGLLWNNSMLLPFIRENYPVESEERILMEQQNFHCYFDSIRLLRERPLHGEELRRVREKQIESRKNGDLSILRKNVGWKYLSLFVLPFRIGSVIFSMLVPYLPSKVNK
ncbi:MAG: glycosyltransferase family 2 protein [Muribaculaceae bacterium]|nr:glycosyltransferase family 2 protein [Muribaculaceae bacterium]